MSESLLKKSAAAKELGICTKTLMEHVAAGEIPYIIVGRGTKRKSIRFAPSDLASFREQNRRVAECRSSKGVKKASTDLSSKSNVKLFSDRLAARRNEKR
jgi:hypothetical protein